MIDLETLSTKTNASIIEIAAVAFDINTGQIDNEIDILISPDYWGKDNRDVSGDTILWWMQQSPEASTRFKQKGTTLERALHDLFSFINNYSYQEVYVWGNGATFDISILQSAYEYFEISLPWKFRNIRDLRTIVALQPDIKDKTEFVGIKHNALDDCKHQIKYLVNTMQSVCRK